MDVLGIRSSHLTDGFHRRVAIFHGRPKTVQSVDVGALRPVHSPQIWPSSSAEQTAHVLATLRLNEMLNDLSQEMSVHTSLRPRCLSD